MNTGKSMTKTAKVALVIVVVALLGVGIWWWTAGQNGATNAPTAANSVSPTPAASTSPSNQTPGTALNSSGNSNADLNANLSQIDGQMNAMNSDNASITQGMNDQPVQQSSL